MTKTEAKRIAAQISDDELIQMFKIAQEAITDWTIPSKINPSISKGAAFNILSAGLMSSIKVIGLVKRNAVYEFGEYVYNPNPATKKKTKPQIVLHQEPKILD